MKIAYWLRNFTVIGIPSFGLAVIFNSWYARPPHPGIEGPSGLIADSKSNQRSVRTLITLASIIASCWPVHRRGPVENGCQASVEPFRGAEKRSGSNSFGLSHSFSSRCMAELRIQTMFISAFIDLNRGNQ
jgi:hypothetical protein